MALLGSGNSSGSGSATDSTSDDDCFGAGTGAGAGAGAGSSDGNGDGDGGHNTIFKLAARWHLYLPTKAPLFYLLQTLIGMFACFFSSNEPKNISL